MSDILQKIRESNSLLLKAEGADIVQWSKLRHTKNDLELFLQFNIAEIEFRKIDGSDDNIICTSNAALLKILETKKKTDKEKLINFRGSGINTKDIRSVMTWDLVDNKYKTISLNAWQIKNFISINPKNILLLDELINKIIKR